MPVRPTHEPAALSVQLEARSHAALELGSVKVRGPLAFGVTEGTLTSGKDGVQFLRASKALPDYPLRMADRLAHWAREAPERRFIAQRERLADGTRGDWRAVTYGEAWRVARNIAQALLDRKLSADRPVLILSENDIEHALLALGCLVAGVPWCPASAPYSLISTDYSKLRHVYDTLTPGLVFAADTRYAKAIVKVVAPDVEVVLAHGQLEDRPFTPFQALVDTPATAAVDEAMAATGPDTIVKFLFTSGSTKLPKAVINTQRMLCANQQQMRQSMPVLADADNPPVLVDWLPWNHTFGGNHNFGMVLYNGGTLYIDDGKPTAALMHETLRNLREVAPTLYFNVPNGFELIAHAMHGDDQLRRTLLSRVRMFFYAGAALAQPIWDSLYASAEKEVGERIVMTTSMGMTESAPFAIFVTSPHIRAGELGLPTPGMEIKLSPNSGKLELRYKGPNITPGYWRNPEATREAFDDEGFFCSGDAVQWSDPDDLHRGIRFDGRIAEDFKLATGTFVSVGPLRGKIIAAGAPYVQDAVITGHGEHEVGAMLIPIVPAVRKLSALPESASLADVLASKPVLDHFQGVINKLAESATGSANRVARLCLLTDPPSLDKGEITDKGSINQRAVLTHRAATVTALHDDSLPNIVKPGA